MKHLSPIGDQSNVELRRTAAGKWAVFAGEADGSGVYMRVVDTKGEAEKFMGSLKRLRVTSAYVLRDEETKQQGVAIAGSYKEACRMLGMKTKNARTIEVVPIGDYLNREKKYQGRGV